MYYALMRKCIALLFCGALAFSATACNKDDGIITEDEMPYGATMAVNLDDYILPVQYDYRFITEDMLDVITRYYYAIQTQNDELFQEVQFPLYHDYQLNEVLDGEYTDQVILENTHKAITEFNEGDFAFSFIDITDAEKGKEYTTSAPLLEIMDSLSEEKDGTKISKKIKHFYELTITRYVADAGSNMKGETNKALQGEKLFVFQCEDKWYILYC